MRPWVLALLAVLLGSACGHYGPPSRTPEEASARKAAAVAAAEACDPEEEAVAGEPSAPGAAAPEVQP
jgi:hypothetical protein